MVSHQVYQPPSQRDLAAETPYTTLMNKIQTRRAQVSIVGLGYVGLTLGVAFAEAGFHVTGIDVDNDKVVAIKRGESPIGDVQ